MEKREFKGVQESNPINGKSQMRQEIIKVTSRKSFEKMIEMLESMGELIFGPSRNYDHAWPSFSFDLENEPPVWTRDGDQMFTITDVEFLEKYKVEQEIMKEKTWHTVTIDDNMQLSEDMIKLYSGIIERSGIKIVAKHEMKTEGTIKGKKKFTLEEWKKEADAARKRAIYWKKQSDQWEGRFFLVQDSIGGEIEAINKKLEIAETQLRWANDANKELKESNIELRGANDEMIQNLDHLRERLELQTKGVKALEEDASKYRLEIKLLKMDFENEKSDLQRIHDDYEVLKNIQRHTSILGWAGWIFFFVVLFGFIFLKS